MSGVWNAPETASGSARRAPAALQFSIASCERRLFAGDNELTRAVVVDRTDNAVLDCCAGLFDLRVLKAENRSHAAVNRVCCVLHQLAAFGNNFNAVRECNNACRCKGGVLAKRKTGRSLERYSVLAQSGQSSHRVRKNSNLAVFGARKGLLVAVEAQLCDVDACAVAGFFEYQARRLANSHKGPCPCQEPARPDRGKMQNRIPCLFLQK